MIQDREQIAAVFLGRGRECRVGLAETDARIGVSVREWILPEAYRMEDLRVVKGSTSKPRRGKVSGYVGPDGRRGLSLLSAEAAIELGEQLVRAGVRAMELSEAEGVPA